MPESSESSSQYASYPSIRNRRVLITGGATGIGESFVSRFHEQGAKVTFLDIDDEAAHLLVTRLAKESGDQTDPPLYRHCDMTDVFAVKTVINNVIHSMAGLDVLINNAANDQRHTIDEVTPEIWDRLMAVNLRHQFFTTQAVLPALRQSSSASIINMSSIAWMIPSTGLPVYVTAKAAIVGMTRTLAHEVGKDNIRVNCLLPGAILTEKQQRLWMTPEYSAEVLAAQALKRHLVPDEVARLALFLAADDSSGITGQSFIVDGGWI